MTPPSLVDRRKTAPCVVLQGDESDGLDPQTPGTLAQKPAPASTPDTQRIYLADCRLETKKEVSFRG